MFSSSAQKMSISYIIAHGGWFWPVGGVSSCIGRLRSLHVVGLPYFKDLEVCPAGRAGKHILNPLSYEWQVGLSLAVYWGELGILSTRET